MITEVKESPQYYKKGVPARRATNEDVRATTYIYFMCNGNKLLISSEG